MKIYIIIMHKYGDNENHSYLYSVEDDKHKAFHLGSLVEQERGNKYEAEIIEMEVGKPHTRKIIKQIYCQKMGKPKNKLYKFLEKLNLLP